MKKVIGVLVLLLLLLLIGGGIVWHRRGANRDASGGGTSGSREGPGHASAGGDFAPENPAIPAWLVTPGAPSRRIAGRVVFHGAPVAGAKVSLGITVTDEPMPLLTDMDHTGPGVMQALAERTTGSDGLFDFGVQPAVKLNVSAGGPNAASAALSVDNANPHVRADQLVLQLGDCKARVFGMIADASGGPISKARITSAGLSGAESDATGHYSLCVVAGKSLGTPLGRIRVEADGYGTLARNVIVVGNLRQDFFLVPEAVLVGKVTTSDGAPVAGARVIANMEPVEIEHDLASRWADSDREGRFRIIRLAPGAFQVVAEVRGARSAPIPVIARPAKSSGELHLVIDNEPTAQIRGRAYRKGSPASGVQLLAVQGSALAGNTISQTDGSFLFDRVPYGATKLSAPPAQPDPRKDIEVASPRVDDVRFDIEHVATVSGHVTRKGKPAGGADVIYLVAPQATLFGPRPRATTDASGAYSILVPFGAGQILVSDSASKSFANAKPLTITSEDDQTVDLVLDLAGEVQGTVVDEVGASVPGAYVRLDRTEGDDQCEAIADDNGHYACTMLEGGAYRPTVTPSAGARRGFAPATGDHFAVIQVPQDGVVTGVQLAIKNERLAISGTVVDDTGAALADVRVQAVAPGDSSMGYPATLTDTAGHFEIASLAPGAYDLDARAADGGDGTLAAVTAGTTTVAIKIMRPGAIEGTLTGFSSMPDVFVMSANNGDRGRRAVVDGNTFSRVALPPGQYVVNAMAGPEADGQTIEIAAGETKHVELRNRGTGSVEGTVTELGPHTPIAGMRCDAHLSLGGPMSIPTPDPAHQAFTDSAGHFVVSAPLGHARVVCFTPSGGPLSSAGADVDVASGGRATVSVASVRATFGDSPGDAGFTLVPGVLPLTVGGVLPAGPAKAAGLRPGDHVLSIDGTALQGVLPDGAMTLIMNHHAGTTVTLGIQRGGAAETVKIVVGGPPG